MHTRVDLLRKVTMKVLVTGGSGYVGNHLCTMLIESNFQVRILDKIKPRLLGKQNIEFIQGDILDSNICDKAVEDCDIVIHAAAILPLSKTLNKNFNTNICGTQNICKSIEKNSRVSHLIYLSSYAPLPDAELSLSWQKLQNESYLASKLKSEQYILGGMNSRKSLSKSILRLGTVMSSDREGIFSVLSQAINSNSPIIIPMKRNEIFCIDFIHIEDVF